MCYLEVIALSDVLILRRAGGMCLLLTVLWKIFETELLLFICYMCFPVQLAGVFTVNGLSPGQEQRRFRRCLQLTPRSLLLTGSCLCVQYAGYGDFHFAEVLTLVRLTDEQGDCC